MSMLHDCDYDKVKLVHELSALAWFIEKHAKPNAKKNNDTECAMALDSLQADLEKQVKKLSSLLKF